MLQEMQVERVGLVLSEFVQKCGLEFSVVSALPASLQPMTVRVGRRHIVVEEPMEYLRRLRSSAPATEGDTWTHEGPLETKLVAHEGLK